MNYIDTIINQVINNFDFTYMLLCNIMCYFMIRTHDSFNGNKKVPTWNKRLYLIISIVVNGSIYYYVGNKDIIILINSSILAPVFWSWIAAPILRKFGISYKKVNDDLK